ncbi:MAG: hypothetical protein K1X67_26055 [Fimbriimonadaceae bacterium]|nr:hypothetical protein [Fimbriimonadaceae bacterium]
MTHEDLAFQTLAGLAAEGPSGLPATLIEAAYSIQKRHQFDHDRSAAIQELQDLIEQHVKTSGERAR